MDDDSKVAATRPAAPAAALRSMITLITISVMPGCGLDDPQVPRVLYFDPPNELVEGDPNSAWLAHQYVVRMTPDGYDTADRKRYDGDPVYIRNNAWNPDDQLIYAYRANFRPGETWLMGVSVPGMKTEALTAIPARTRGGSFSPLFAYDTRSRRLAAADAQRPCGGQLTNIWYVYDVASGDWSEYSLDGYAFTTLDFDESRGSYVGVGFQFGAGRIVVRLDGEGKVLSRAEADLCNALEPRSHGYERVYYQSQIVDGVVQVYRHVYYGKHAKDGRYWERQRYLVDIETGAVSRD